MDAEPPAQPRGVLKFPVGDRLTHLVRLPPPSPLAPFVEVFWMVHWDLRGRDPYLQENIPAPCANLTIDAHGGRVVGPVKGRFSYWLREEGRVFGIKFHPGGLQPFFGRDMALLTDRDASIQEVFGRPSEPLIAAIEACDKTDYEGMIQRGADFLSAPLPPVDPKVAQIRELIALIATEPSISHVDQLATACHMSKRTLQRLFRTYVGLSPKWVIRCHRLQEALARIEKAEDLDWAMMALALGYFDQAHFIKDFKAITGRSPAQYQRELQQALAHSAPIE